MRNYSNIISLVKNSRGIYSLDTSIGCHSGLKNEVKGCYNDCYAYNSATRYGYDFSNTIFRDFSNERHRKLILNKINKSSLDFIRIGTSGDPSENWSHTISILKKIDKCNKEIVIITKHWDNLNNEQLDYLSTINVCINTSVSALDKPHLLNNSLAQYNILKKYCKSILRIVSCDFNLENIQGKIYYNIQKNLFLNESIIDTILRVSKNNSLVKDGVIKVAKSKFLDGSALISRYNKKTYFGKCSNCHEMCGVKISVKNKEFPDKKGITKQQKLF